MAPKVKITRDMIVDAAVEVARQQGHENINARTVARQLGCSTQPVMYHFATIDALKRAAYGRLDGQHTEYLLRCEPEADPLLSIGLNYLRFAVEKPLLFRFLFQSGYAAENSVSEMIDSEEMRPILAAMQEGLGMDTERTRDVFVTLGLFTHGYASILANHTMTFDENLAAARLERAFNGAVAAVLQEEENT